MIQTALPRRSARLIGLPSRSVNGVFVPSAAVRASSGGGRRVGGPGPAPARGCTGSRAGRRATVAAVVPSGVVTITSPTATATTRIAASGELAAAERPDQPVLLALVGEGRTRLGGGMSDTGEVEPGGQEPEPVEDHREADRDDEQAADDRDGPAVADQRPEDRRRAVEQHRDQQERDAEPERVGDQQDAALGDGRGLRREAEDPAEDDPDARRPADGEDRAQPEAGEPAAARSRAGRRAGRRTSAAAGVAHRPRRTTSCRSRSRRSPRRRRRAAATTGRGGGS